MDIVKKIQKQKMKSALRLSRAFCDLIEGKHGFDEGAGCRWIDFYPYEPLEYGKGQLVNLINALLCVATRAELDWEFRLFGADGSLTTMADGSKPEEGDEFCVALIDHNEV